MSEQKKGLVPRLRFPEFREAGEWEQTSFGKLARFISGGTPSKDVPDYWNGSIPWISASSMHDTRIEKSDFNITEAAVKAGTRIAKEGTLLLLVRGSMLHKRIPIGIAAIDVAFNQDVKAIELKGNTTEQYLLHFLSAHESLLLGQVTSTGIGAGKLDTNNLNEFAVTISTPEEQQKIAACLSSLDALIAAQADKLDALKTHKKGLMQQLFPREGETVPRLRFPEFREAGEWEVKALSRLIEVVSGQVDPTSPQHCDLPHVGSDNIESHTGTILNVKTAKELQLISGKYAFDVSHILYSKIRPALNKVARPNFKGICSADIYPIRQKTSDLVKDYLYYLLLSETFLAYATKHSDRGKIPKVNREALLAYTVALPVPAEQEKIAACLSSLDTLIAAQAHKLDALKTHKKGLMQQLFPSPEAIRA